jgi:hypothetical protein
VYARGPGGPIPKGSERTRLSASRSGILTQVRTHRTTAGLRAPARQRGGRLVLRRISQSLGPAAGISRNYIPIWGLNSGRSLAEGERSCGYPGTSTHLITRNLAARFRRSLAVNFCRGLLQVDLWKSSTGPTQKEIRGVQMNWHRTWSVLSYDVCRKCLAPGSGRKRDGPLLLKGIAAKVTCPDDHRNVIGD